MSFVSHLQCTACGAEYPADAVMNLCPVDNRPVEIIIDVARLNKEQPNLAWYNPERNDMWRFGGLLPLDINDIKDRAHIFNLGEGHTALLQYNDHPLAVEAGFSLAIKDEGQPHAGYGANPTQSFKDRGMAMTISMAHKAGIKKLAVPTQGNAGDSLCEYVLAAGMEAVVAMPDNTPAPILDRVADLARESERFNIELVTGTIREAGALLKEKWLDKGYGDPWELPDVVIYPTGGGTGVLGMWKAWNELEALGLIDHFRPRVICVQAEPTQPLVIAFESGADDTIAAEPGDTLAYGVNVPGGVGHFRVLEIIRESGGAAVAVAEDDIHSTLSRVVKDKGWSICPEGAACLAALPQLLEKGLINPGNKVVVFNTGSLEKYLPDLQHLL